MTHKNWCGEDLTDEEYQELLDEEREFWDNQDHPERDAGEAFQDKLDMYRNEY